VSLAGCDQDSSPMRESVCSIADVTLPPSNPTYTNPNPPLVTVVRSKLNSFDWTAKAALYRHRFDPLISSDYYIYLLDTSKVDKVFRAIAAQLIPVITVVATNTTTATANKPQSNSNSGGESATISSFSLLSSTAAANSAAAASSASASGGGGVDSEDNRSSGSSTSSSNVVLTYKVSSADRYRERLFITLNPHSSISIFGRGVVKNFAHNFDRAISKNDGLTLEMFEKPIFHSDGFVQHGITRFGDIERLQFRTNIGSCNW
jgi:hypothetical protein